MGPAVKARVAALAAGVVMLAAALGFSTWVLVRSDGPQLPRISAYTHGQLVRVDPFEYCNVLDLNDCQTPHAQGELRVTSRDAVQLSVPTSISAAPWRLLQVYDDPANATTTAFRPRTRSAVTIATVDPHRGRLTGIAVQLVTLVVGPDGELHDAVHAEWSVRMVWD